MTQRFIAFAQSVALLTAAGGLVGCSIAEAADPPSAARTRPRVGASDAGVSNPDAGGVSISNDRRPPNLAHECPTALPVHMQRCSVASTLLCGNAPNVRCQCLTRTGSNLDRKWWCRNVVMTGPIRPPELPG